MFLQHFEVCQPCLYLQLKFWPLLTENFKKDSDYKSSHQAKPIYRKNIKKNSPQAANLQQLSMKRSHPRISTAAVSQVYDACNQYSSTILVAFKVLWKNFKGMGAVPGTSQRKLKNTHYFQHNSPKSFGKISKT